MHWTNKYNFVRDRSNIYLVPGPAPSTGGDNFFREKKGAKTFFEKISGVKSFFLIKKGGESFFSEKRGRGAMTYLKQIFPKT